MVEIDDFFKSYESAAWHKDAGAMLDLYAEDALIFDMWNKGSYQNHSQWADLISNWLNSLGQEKVKVNFEMVNIRQSGDVGFATAFIQFQAISTEGVVLRSMKNRITLGFIKTDNAWKVIHQHTSAPISSKDLGAILDI